MFEIVSVSFFSQTCSGSHAIRAISRSSQCSMTGVTKVILSVGLCI